jgi:hypothetical protein
MSSFHLIYLSGKALSKLLPVLQVLPSSSITTPLTITARSQACQTRRDRRRSVPAHTAQTYQGCLPATNAGNILSGQGEVPNMEGNATRWLIFILVLACVDGRFPLYYLVCGVFSSG